MTVTSQQLLYLQVFMLSPDFAVVGAALNLVGCISYALDTLKGKTKPNRVGWSLWALAPLVAFAAEVVQGVRLQSLITLAACLGPLLVLAASTVNKGAYWRIKPFDWYCAVLSLMALILWLITGKGDVAIVLSIAGDVLAGLPTIRKSYTHPHTESSKAFGIQFFGTLLGLLTIQHWTFANYAFPAYLMVANGTIAAVIFIRGRLISE